MMDSFKKQKKMDKISVPTEIATRCRTKNKICKKQSLESPP